MGLYDLNINPRVSSTYATGGPVIDWAYFRKAYDNSDKQRAINWDNLRYIDNWLNKHGYNLPQRQAIIYNIYQESGGDPTAVSEDGRFAGLLQWDTEEGGRYNKIKDKSLDGQLQYIYDTTYGNLAFNGQNWMGKTKATTRSNQASFKNAKTAREAMRVFTNGYVRPNPEVRTNRMDNFQTYFPLEKQIPVMTPPAGEYQVTPNIVPEFKNPYIPEQSIDLNTKEGFDNPILQYRGNHMSDGGPIKDKYYNTKLTAEQEKLYKDWVNTLPTDLRGDYDYDLRGAFLDGLKPDKNHHMPDKYKKPWHPTFSNESMYSSPGMGGGTRDGGTFIPSNFNNYMNTINLGDWGQIYFSNGGSIHIKPENRGKFTAAANRAGKSVQGYASQILAHPENYSPTLRKRAQFAHNAAKWHACGGKLYPDGGPIDPPALSAWNYVDNNRQNRQRMKLGYMLPESAFAYQQAVNEATEQGNLDTDEYHTAVAVMNDPTTSSEEKAYAQYVIDMTQERANQMVRAANTGMNKLPQWYHQLGLDTLDERWFKGDKREAMKRIRNSGLPNIAKRDLKDMYNESLSAGIPEMAYGVAENIPGIGDVLSGAAGVSDFIKGDIPGGLLELAAVAPFVPGGIKNAKKMKGVGNVFEKVVKPKPRHPGEYIQNLSVAEESYLTEAELDALGRYKPKVRNKPSKKIRNTGLNREALPEGLRNYDPDNPGTLWEDVFREKPKPAGTYPTEKIKYEPIPDMPKHYTSSRGVIGDATRDRALRKFSEAIDNPKSEVWRRESVQTSGNSNSQTPKGEPYVKDYLNYRKARKNYLKENYKIPYYISKWGIPTVGGAIAISAWPYITDRMTGPDNIIPPSESIYTNEQSTPSTSVSDKLFDARNKQINAVDTVKHNNIQNNRNLLDSLISSGNYNIGDSIALDRYIRLLEEDSANYHNTYSR